MIYSGEYCMDFQTIFGDSVNNSAIFCLKKIFTICPLFDNFLD